MSDEQHDPQLTRDIAPFGLRMPAGLKSRIKRVADENGRSMNAELVDALARMFPPPETSEKVAVGILREIVLTDADIREGVIEIVKSAVTHPDFSHWVTEMARSLPEDDAISWRIAAGLIERHIKKGRFAFDKTQDDVVPF